MSADSPVALLYDNLGNPVGVLFDGTIYRLQVQALLTDGYNTLGVSSNPVRTDTIGQTPQPVVGSVVAFGGTRTGSIARANPLLVGGQDEDGYVQMLSVDGYGVAGTFDGAGFKKSALIPLTNGISTNLAVNGSSSPETFTLPALPIGQTFYLYELQILINDDGYITSNKTFGNQVELTHGLTISFIQYNQTFNFQYNFKTNADIFGQADIYVISSPAYSNNSSLVSAKFKFKPPIEFTSNGYDMIQVIVSDNLSAIPKITINAVGLLG
jgi:hypothetical protein